VSLFRRRSGVDDIERHLLSRDVIYVGGGSLLNLVAIWGAHGVDDILREAWAAGTVLCGISAGSMCWFTDGAGLLFAGTDLEESRERARRRRRLVGRGGRRRGGRDGA
jgi:peptidase E